MQVYYVYILFSESKDRYYIGHTSDLKERIKNHNQGNSKYAKAGVPWVLVYSKEYSTIGEAMSREYQIKKWKSRKMIEKLINDELEY